MVLQAPPATVNVTPIVPPQPQGVQHVFTPVPTTPKRLTALEKGIEIVTRNFPGTAGAFQELERTAKVIESSL